MVDGTPHHYGVTTPREVLLEKLVVSLHLNVPERRILGSDSVSMLRTNKVFPPTAKTWQPGEPVLKGFFLVVRPRDVYKRQCQNFSRREV